VHNDGTFRIWADERLSTNKISRYSSYEWFPKDLPIGSETNWLAVAGNGEKIVTLKNDGTLWLWNFRRSSLNGWDQNQFETEIQKTVPVRLGAHADWLAISGDWGSVTALAADGSVWWWPLENAEQRYNGSSDNAGIHPILDSSRKPQLLGNIFSNAD